jgi:hypothetical protein
MQESSLFREKEEKKLEIKSEKIQKLKYIEKMCNGGNTTELN